MRSSCAMLLRWLVFCGVLAGWLGGHAAAAANRKLRLTSVEQLAAEEESRKGQDCFVSVRPFNSEGRYALVAATVMCASEDDLGRRQYRPRKGFLSVVDWKAMRVAGTEIATRADTSPLGLTEIEGRPAVLLAQGGDLLLQIADDEAPVYRWECPLSDCPRPLQAQVLGLTGFPLEPLRVAVVEPERFLVSVYDLYPPEPDAEKGYVQQVDAFVPVDAWKQELRQATNIEQQVKDVFLNSNLLTKYASYLPLIGREIEEAIYERIDRDIDNAWLGIALHVSPKHGLFLGTQQPFSLTRVDVETGKFAIHDLSDFGAHICPLSLEYDFNLLDVLPGNSRDEVGLVVEGGLCEGAAQYSARETKPCPTEVTQNDAGEDVCCYGATALVIYDLKANTTRWQIWENHEGKESVSRLVVEVTKTGATCLVTRKENGPARVIVRERCER